MAHLVLLTALVSSLRYDGFTVLGFTGRVSIDLLE